MFDRHVINQLSSYLDNQLSDSKKKKIDEHLKVCKVCSEELARLKLVSEKLKAWHVPDLENSFDSAVTTQIIRQELERGRVKMEKKTRLILVPAGAIAGILFLVISFVGLQAYFHRGIQGRQLVSAKKTGEEYRSRQTPKNGFLIRAGSEMVGYGGDKKFAIGVLSEGERTSLNYAKTDSIKLNDLSRVTYGVNSYEYDDVQSFGMAGARVDNGRIITRSEFAKSESTSIVATTPDSPVIIVQPVLPGTAEAEMVIRTGNVSLEIENGKETYQQVIKICRELGGYISDSRFYRDNEGREAGSVTMRIPKEKFDTALDKLGSLGKIENINVVSQDVNQEYTNLKSRLDTAMIVYEKMLEALKQRKVQPTEAVKLESELTPILNRIEDLKNKIEYLNNQVSYNTITLNFFEPRVSAKVFKESKHIIKETILSTGINAVKFVAVLIPIVLVIGFWVVIAVVAIWAIKYLISKLLNRK
ncbi:MAG: DUF4349 domain-containing protein [Candidatus Omnitrophica bacterium]|nr:DUF4349 domain-containing protein [Candidatus Omnitrophota bacterium]